MGRHGPPRALQAGPVQAAGGEGMSEAAGHGPRRAVVQALQAGAGGGRGDGGGPRGRQGVREVALAADLAAEPRGLVDLRERGEVHDVVVAVGAQVGRALPGLVAVLQQDGGARLVGRPPPLVVQPLPQDAAAQPRRLGEQGAAHGPGLPCGVITVNPHLVRL